MLQRRHTCPECGKPLSFEDRQCPFCGAEVHKKLDKRKLSIIFAVVLISLALFSFFQEDILRGIQKQEYDSERKNLQEEPFFPYYDVSPSQAAGEDCSYFWEDIDARLDYLNTLPEQEQDAFQAACWTLDTPEGMSHKVYLREMRKKRIEEKEAEAVLSHLQPDWNHEALKAALFTFRRNGSSRKGIEKMLEHMGFLPEEIQYAMDHCSPHYGQQAALDLQFWLKISRQSKRDCKWHLEDQYFTEEDIRWALENAPIDWKEMAYHAGLSYFAVNAEDRENLAERLRRDGFSEEEIRYAAEKLKIPVDSME